MSDYHPPTWKDHLRIYFKACRIVAEPALVAGVMGLLGAPWWSFVAMALIWIPYGKLRLRDLRNDWVS
jgi:hypothetical protein